MSLTPFISRETTRLEPSNTQLLIEHIAQLPEDQFQAAAMRMQWDEIITAPQAALIDGEEQVISKQVLSPLQYAIAILPPQRLAWLLPLARDRQKIQSRYCRHDEGLIHKNDLCKTLLATAISTGDRKKIDVVLDQVTPDDHHNLMRLPSDDLMARHMESITPDENLTRIPSAIRHAAKRLLNDVIMADSMFRTRPSDAKLLASGIQKTMMSAYAVRGRQQALDAAYTPGRKVPMKVWQSALDHGGLIQWCLEKIPCVSKPKIRDAHLSNDWSAQKSSCNEPCAMNVMRHACFQIESANKSDFLAPSARQQQLEWTINAINAMADECVGGRQPSSEDVGYIVRIIPHLPAPIQDALAQRLDQMQQAFPQVFDENLKSSKSELVAWISCGRIDIAIKRGQAFSGSHTKSSLFDIAGWVCLNWCQKEEARDMSYKEIGLIEIEKQRDMHEAWGISLGARKLLDGQSGPKVSDQTCARFDREMMELSTTKSSTPSKGAPRI